MYDNYRDIISAIDHIMLASPEELTPYRDKLLTESDEDYNDYKTRHNDALELNCVSGVRFRQAAEEYKDAMSTGTLPQFLANPENRKVMGSAVHGIGDQAHLEQLLINRPWAVSATRYVAFRCLESQAPGRFAIEWEIALDILVAGDAPLNPMYRPADHNVIFRHDHTLRHPGIYGVGRGEYISRIKNRFLRFPQLCTVVPNPDKFKIVPSDDVPQFNGEGSPFQYDTEGTLDLNITQVSMDDNTDINYWTLLWAHGLPEAFLGWWPNTVRFNVIEHRSYERIDRKGTVVTGGVIGGG